MRATGDGDARAAVDRASELLLAHRLFRHRRSDDVIDERRRSFRYPPYWHYAALQALVVLSRAGRVRDPRAADAIGLVVSKRRDGGTWRSNGAWWRTASGEGSAADVADWGRHGPNEMITLNRAARRDGLGRWRQSALSCTPIPMGCGE